MWRRGGRSAALDRAQALLSAKRNSRGDGESVQRSPASTWEHTSAGGVSVKARSVPLNTHTLLSDVSDLSSVSSASEHGAAGKIQGREAGPPQDLRPQSSMGGERGGGSRFLKKKAPPAAAVSSTSSHLVSKSQMEQPPPPHLRGSQTAALSRLADIESRIRSRKQVGQLLKPASDLGTSPTPAPPTPPAAAAPQSVRLSPQSSGEQSPRGKRFLKSSRAEGANTSKPAGPNVGAGSGSRAADAAGPLAGSEMRRLTGVSLESDEEDMKKLLGDSLDSIDTSYLPHGRPKPTRTADEMAIRSSQKVSSTPPPPAAVPPSSSSSSSISSPRSPASPFRFIGRPQAHFSSSALSPPPSPPRASPSPPGSPSPRRPLSSLSSSSVVLSLAELFPVGPGDPHSETSVVSTDDFKMNVLMLDDLLPVELGFTETKPDKEEKSELASQVPASPTQQQLLRHEEDQEEAPDYESDFESESRRTEAEKSRVSERRPARRHDEELVSEVTEEPSDVSHGRAEDVYSDTFSDAGSSYSSPASPDPSGRASRESRSCDSRSSSGGRSRRRDSAGKVLKDAAVQAELAPPTYSWPAGLLTVGPAVGTTCPDPTPVIPHLSPETVEALSSFNPAAFVLNELLKQQLATTRRFIESSRQLHASLVRSLGPPNYRYTTLEDTLEHIRKLRPPRPTVQGRLK